MKQISHFFSFVFSPLLVPTYAVALALWCSVLCFVAPSAKWQVVGIAFLVTAVVPAVLIAGLKALGLVSDLGLNHQKERTLPYCLVCLSYLVMAFLFYSWHLPSWMVLFMAGATLAVIVSMIVNIWWKISAHLAAMGGAIGMLLRVMADNDAVASTFPMLLTMIIMAGCVGTARVYLERHTLGQVIAGTFNGALCVWLITAW